MSNKAPRVALLNIHRTVPYRQGYTLPVPAKDAGYNPQEWASRNRGIPFDRLVLEVVRVDDAPVTPALLRLSKLELSKASKSKSKEQAKKKFFKVCNSDRFLFKKPSSWLCPKSRSSQTPPIRQVQIPRVKAPTPDHWAGSSATISRYFPDRPN